MKSGLDVETITRGLLALQRIKLLYNPPQRSETEPDTMYLQPDRLSLLRDTLTAVTDFLPATRSSSFSEAFRLGSHYSSTYRGIKQHFHEMSSGSNAEGIGLTQLAKTLSVIAPVFSSREKGYMDKVIQIIGILNS